ncbi:MAG TPA: methyltransferase domain-containing protein [Usitatibacter sp.]|nr:methyltransferase domain-containing protein [Usitatibacter sp.]
MSTTLTAASPREQKLLANIDPASMRGLEIGPLHRPIALKRNGYVKYVDHNSTEELRRRFVNDPVVRPEDIADVDFVIKGGKGILDVVTEKFDYIIASHVFEHVPNPVLWLNEMHALLNPGGILSLAIPDRRYTFDILRPQTSLGEVIEAYVTKRETPPFRHVFDQHCYWRDVNAFKLWDGVEDLSKIHAPSGIPSALEIAKKSLEPGVYHDVHCNVLADVEFRFIFGALQVLGYVRLELAQFFDTAHHTNEFVVQLKAPA